MIKYDAKLLAAVALARSFEETRYYLNGVLFHDSVAVATDGHILTKATNGNDNGPGQRIMPVSKKAITAMKNRKADHVVFDNDTLTVFSEIEEVMHIEPSKEIDGTFPDYMRVIPHDPGEVHTGAFSAIVLKTICETAAVLGKDVPISMVGKTKGDPHNVTYHGYDGIMSTAMPIRT